MKLVLSPSKIIVKMLILSKGLAFAQSGLLSLLLVLLSNYGKISSGKIFLIIFLAPPYLYSSATNPGAAGMFALLVLLILKPKFNLNLNLRPTIYLTILLIIFQFLYSTNQGSERPHLIGYEQNFSALAVLILYLLVQDKNRIWFFIVGISTVSRMFALAVVIRETLLYFRFSKIGRGTFIVSILILFTAFFVAQYVVLSAAVHKEYSSGILRLFYFNDTSNLSRFSTNLFFIDVLSSNFSDYLFSGERTADYLEHDSRIVAHNSILQMTLLYGIVPFLIYFIIIVYFFSQSLALRISFLALLFCSLFLHSVLTPINIALVYIALFRIRTHKYA